MTLIQLKLTKIAVLTLAACAGGRGQVVTSKVTIPLSGTVSVTNGATVDRVQLFGAMNLTTQIPGNPIIPGNPVMPSRVITTLVNVKGTSLVSGASYNATGTSVFKANGPPIAASGLTFTAAFRLVGPPIIPGNPIAPQIALSLPISLALSSTGQITTAAVQTSGVLWMGNDCVSAAATATDIAGVILANVPGQVTGIASDGTNLYFSDCYGNFTKRTSDGNTVLASFAIPASSVTEDMAWDSKRGRMWRLQHYPPTLQRIDPSTGTVDASYLMPNADAVIFPRGALGVAYNAATDQLYVSFCQAGCANWNAGVVSAFDAATGNPLGDLFRVSGYLAGGLAFDPVTDTLWMGTGDGLTNSIQNVTLTGTVFSTFPRPYGYFADGLEFIGGGKP